MIYVVDDERTFDNSGSWRRSGSLPVVYFRNSNDALAGLARLHVNQNLHYMEALEQLWLDHDLGGMDSIHPVVDFLTLVHVDVEQIMVHSMNPASGWIVAALKSQGYNVERAPLPLLLRG